MPSGQTPKVAVRQASNWQVQNPQGYQVRGGGEQKQTALGLQAQQQLPLADNSRSQQLGLWRQYQTKRQGKAEAGTHPSDKPAGTDLSMSLCLLPAPTEHPHCCFNSNMHAPQAPAGRARQAWPLAGTRNVHACKSPPQGQTLLLRLQHAARSAG